MWVIFFLIFILVTAEVPSVERAALVDFYSSLDGEHWHHNDGWIEGDPCDNAWWGLMCDQRNSTVIGIVLEDNFLRGQLPDSIGDLVNLIEIDVKRNWVSGALPETMGKLVNMYAVGFMNNMISALPSTVGGMRKMQFFHCDYNEISGPLPESLCDMTDAVVVGLSHNRITGEIPACLFKSFENLEQVTLGSNAFTGPVPSTVGRYLQEKLEAIDMSNNQLTGQLPSSFSNGTAWPAIQELNLADNNLNGLLPDFAKMPTLQLVSVAGNAFVGWIPDNLNTLPILDTFIASSNMLSGLLPASLDRTKAGVIELDGNLFYCPLPAWSSKYGVNSCDTITMEKLSPASGVAGGGNVVNVMLGPGAYALPYTNLVLRFGQESAAVQILGGHRLRVVAPPGQGSKPGPVSVGLYVGDVLVSTTAVYTYT